MPNLIVFDSDVRNHLLPLTYSRPVGDLRVGILTIREKWERYLSMPGSFLTDASLKKLFPVKYGENNLLVNGAVLPDEALANQVMDLLPGQAYQKEGVLVAACLDRQSVEALINADDFDNIEAFELTGDNLHHLRRPYDIFSLNDLALRRDFELLTAGRKSAPISETNTLIGPRENLFLEEGVTLEACTLNFTNGPIYLAEGATVLEGCLVRGPLAVGEGALLKMGAKIYGATTVGPQCKVGGEINNVVFYGRSNKGHDGFLGNAVVGEWCNIGADTNASNLKNDYGEVRVWDYVDRRFSKTGKQFHGLIMGDHSKLGINTMLNTGTVIGFSANVYGEGFPRPFIPSFSWGSANGFTTYRLDKAVATAERVLARRGQSVTPELQALFQTVHERSAEFRKE